MRTSINQIVIGQERDAKHPQKNAVFDILSLTDQLYHFKSTGPKAPKQGKIYSLENQVPDLIDLDQKYLARVIALYNESIKRE